MNPQNTTSMFETYTEPELVAAKIRRKLNYEKRVTESDIKRLEKCSDTLDKVDYSFAVSYDMILLERVQNRLKELEQLRGVDFELEPEPTVDDLRSSIALIKSDLEFVLKYNGILSDTLVEAESKPAAVRDVILKRIQSGLATLNEV